MIMMPSINHQGQGYRKIINTYSFFTNVVKWQVLIEFLNTRIILMQNMLAAKRKNTTDLIITWNEGEVDLKCEKCFIFLTK